MSCRQSRRLQFSVRSLLFGTAVVGVALACLPLVNQSRRESELVAALERAKFQVIEDVKQRKQFQLVRIAKLVRVLKTFESTAGDDPLKMDSFEVTSR